MHREACQATVYRVTKSQTQTERLAHTRLKLLLLLFFVSLYILLANPTELMLKALGILQKQSHPGGSLCQGMKGSAMCFLPWVASLVLRDFPGSHSQLSLLAPSPSFTCQLL